MPNIKLLKEPGYIYDLSFIFFLRFNQELCREKMTVNTKTDSEDFLRIAKNFGDISDDLYVFFHALENDRCFFSVNYLGAYKDRFATDYGMDLIQNELSDYSVVIKRMIQFYFRDLQEQEIEKYRSSASELFDLIKKSDYTDTEKLKLYEFFINPTPYIQKLQFELMQKHVQLSAYYEKNYLKMLEAFNDLTFDVLTEQLKPIRNFDFMNECGEQFYLSFCLLHKNCIFIYALDNDIACLLGVDYLSTIQHLQDKDNRVQLDEFGSALSELSRVKMLDMMLERGALTCKEFEKEFHFSGSTAYHHLTILTKYGVVKTHNEGKTVYYSVNEQHFDTVIEKLEKYSTQRRRRS